MAILGGSFAPQGRRARHSSWDTTGTRAALLVTLCTPSRATRPVAGRSGGTSWARRPARRYERRRPEKTPLHKIISENLESWLAWRDAAERPVPGYVEDELRGYLACGILCFGFARALCTGCGQGFVVAFSCKGRGVCPSCNGRHMAQTATQKSRSRHPAGAGAAVGDLRAEATAGHARGPTPSRRRRHENLPRRDRADSVRCGRGHERCPRIRPPEARWHLLSAPLRFGAQPSCPPPRLRH